ncbi:MAG: hypothetical protein ACE363_07200 [Alphaproteobacteria bacterium]
MRFVCVLAATLAAVGFTSPATAAPLPDGSFQIAQAPRPLVSGERVRVKKIARDIESAMQTMDQGGVEPFQDPAYVQKWQQSADRFRTALKRYPQMDDPDVQAAHAKLQEMDNMIAFGTGQGAKQTAELGDVQAILANIEQSLRGSRALHWLPAPFDDAEAAAWIQGQAKAKRTARAALAELERIAPTAHLPLTRGTVSQGAAYDKQDLDRLFRFAQSIDNDVDDAMKQTLDNLKLQFEVQDDTLNYYRELDPEDESDRMNAFLGENSEAEIYSGLDRELATAESLAAYQRAFGEEPTAAIQGRIDEIKGLRKTYAENRLDALGDSKLPDPKSKDSKRIAIAKQILAEPSYEFGKHGPIVLTTKDIVDREKQVSRAEIKDVDVSLSGDITLSGTETTWNYKWEEFKFATPIQADNGDWHIWWITAMKYSSGWERTPIGEWVSGRSTKGSLILEDNF